MSNLLTECWWKFLHSWWSGARNSWSGYTWLAAYTSICAQVSWTAAWRRQNWYIILELMFYILCSLVVIMARGLISLGCKMWGLTEACVMQFLWGALPPPQQLLSQMLQLHTLFLLSNL